jgi:tRNA(His) guanylyltransferase
MHDKLSIRMKEFEGEYQILANPDSYLILRLDGRAFHTFTKKLNKPYDATLGRLMEDTTVALCEQIQGVAFGYTQSDEISLLLAATGPTSQFWFGGKVQKVVSVAASIATAEFSARKRLGWPIAHFDARLFALPTKEDVADYFRWRQIDARRNAISATAQAHFSHKQLQGLTSYAMVELLAKAGIEYEGMPEKFKKGVLVRPEEEIIEGTYFDKRTNTLQNYAANRTVFRSVAAPQFNNDPSNEMMLRIPGFERGTL